LGIIIFFLEIYNTPSFAREAAPSEEIIFFPLGEEELRVNKQFLIRASLH